MHSDVVIIIPSRIGSERLAQKPLATIGNITMIEHVVNQIQKTGLKNVYVATDSSLIADKVSTFGAKYIMTRSECASGTDRVYEAFRTLSDDNIKYVVNVQGDMPFVDPDAILEVIKHLKNSEYGIITPVTQVTLNAADGSSNVKVVVARNSADSKVDKALYFSRSLIPHGADEFLYHIGIYGFEINTLAKFVNLPTSNLEKTEKLEQLRAIENNIDIGVCYVDNVPISVDTIEDLNKAIDFYNKNIK